MEELGQEADYLDTTVELDDIALEETEQKSTDTAKAAADEPLYNRNRRSDKML